jgi:hypothetical protein
MLTEPVKYAVRELVCTGGSKENKEPTIAASMGFQLLGG